MRFKGLLFALSTTLIISWGTLYYAFAVLIRPMQAQLGWSANAAMGAFSLALLVSGGCAYPISIAIDRLGGRWVMSGGSLLAGVLFLALSQVQSLAALYIVWIGLGIAMAMTLYEPAFAVLVLTTDDDYRSNISILTLAGGFASSVFWPLTHLWIEHWGWSICAIILGLLHLLICLPLHALAIPPSVKAKPIAHAQSQVISTASRQNSFFANPVFWALGVSFVAFGFVTSAFAAHAIALIEFKGWSQAAAVALAALIGPMQVAGRALELTLGARISVLKLGAMTALLMPLGLFALTLASAPPSSSSVLIYVFIALYGAGVGLSTIIRATSTAQIFGKERYAAASGALATPSLVARSAGPLALTFFIGNSDHHSLALAVLLLIACTGTAAFWLAVWIERRQRSARS